MDSIENESPKSYPNGGLTRSMKRWRNFFVIAYAIALALNFRQAPIVISIAYLQMVVVLLFVYLCR